MSSFDENISSWSDSFASPNQFVPKQTFISFELSFYRLHSGVLYRADRVRQLSQEFSSPLAEGFLQIIGAPADLYPNLNFTSRRRTFNDPPARVAWRTKQVRGYEPNEPALVHALPKRMQLL